MKDKSKLMTVDEVADMLGLSQQGIYNMVFHRRIPSVKLSKRALRFKPSDIEKWIESKTHQAEVLPIKQPIRRSPGRPRKNGASTAYIDRMVEIAKKEVR